MPHTTTFAIREGRAVVGRLAGAAVAAIFLSGYTAPLHAQRIRGLGDDATTIPRGTLRVNVRGEWSSADERYGPATSTAGEGTLRPLGDLFSLDTLGTAEIPALRAVETGLRTLSGLPNVNVTFGKIAVSRTDRVQVTPIVAEVGVTRRLMLGLTVPIVKARASVLVKTNPAGTEGNIALLNSSTRATVVNADTSYGNQMARAAEAAQTYCSGAGAGSTECTTNLSAVNEARTFGQQVSTLYGTAVVLPVANSNIQLAIDARAAQYRDVLNQLAAIIGSGVPVVAATALVAPAPLTTNDLQDVLASPSLGILADTLATIERVHLGDVELSAKLMLWGEAFDDTLAAMRAGFRTRFAVGAAYRAPTGGTTDPANLIDIETGTHESAVGARGYLDVLKGDRFWTSIVGRYWRSLGSDVDVRVTDDPNQTYAAAGRTATVHRRLGNLIELEASPRWVINDFVSLSGQYVYRHQGASAYTGASFGYGPDSTTAGDSVVVSPSSLNVGTGFSEHRAGGGIAFSNLHAYERGEARIPFEVSYMHFETVSGSGDVEKQTRDQVSFRLYYRLFGGGR